MSVHTDRPGRGGNAADAEAVRAVLGGDVERYAELVHRYRDRYARYATQVLGSVDAAEDALQDAFIRAFDQLSQCREPGNFIGWFFHIPADRVITALQALYTREVTALGALRQGGVMSPDDADVEGATFAMGAGLSGSDVSTIAHAGGDAYAAATTMRVAGTLAALGVPAAGAVRLVSVAIASGVASGDLASFPGSVESAMAHGMTPAQAAEGLARATQARHGVPPGHGRPGGKPPKP